MRAAALFRPIVRCLCPTALLLLLVASPLPAAPVPGRLPDAGDRGGPKSEGPLSLSGVWMTTGHVALSVDGLGTTNRTGMVQVWKPVGGTVRAAFLAAATIGSSNALIPDGALTLDGLPVTWSRTMANTIGSRNHLAEVTTQLSAALNAAAPGMIDVLVDEGTLSHLVDGTILAVAWNDPGAVEERTISLLFGAQDVGGDRFNIGLAEPARTGDADFVLDLSLGISFGFQEPTTRDQVSQVTVNGERITSSAGGQDDGGPSNGALLTVGGLGDDGDAPADPGGAPTNFDYDDELYDLKPYVKDGVQQIQVTTVNPSRDDNIFFAALVMSGVALVNEGIALTPVSGEAPVGTPQGVTAILQDGAGARIAGREVTFELLAGPDAGLVATRLTDADGEAELVLPGLLPGVDEIRASFVSGAGSVVVSPTVTRAWLQAEPCPGCPPDPRPEVVAGRAYTLDFEFCNCGAVADSFEARVTDTMGWHPAGRALATAHLAPGECRMLELSGIVPMKLSAADTNRFTFVVGARSTPALRDSCVVRMPVRPPSLAVVLSRFEARPEPGGVRISWETAQEMNHAFFDLLRSEAGSDAFVRINPAPLTGIRHGAYLDGDARPGRTWRYRLESVDRNGVRQVAGETDVTLAETAAPLRLLQNSPNPFSVETAFRLEFDRPTTARLELFHVSGRRVRTLLEGPVSAGPTAVSWDGHDDVGRPAPAGLYFARLTAAGDSRVIRVLFSPR